LKAPSRNNAIPVAPPVSPLHDDMPPPRRVAADADELDHAVAFLKTRDGLDKSLKLLRYAAMLGAFGVDPRGVAGSKLRDLDRSTATARKFLRLGKFLGNARDLRVHWRARERLIEKTPAGAVAAKVRRIEETETRARDAHANALRLNRLNIGCSGASLAYYFLEQFVWAKAVGLIRAPKTNARVAQLAPAHLQRISRFEAFGNSFGLSTEHLEASLDEARRRLFLARVSFCADVADCAACAGEVTGGNANPLRRPGLVGALGLVSALCGVYEKWEATQP